MKHTDENHKFVGYEKKPMSKEDRNERNKRKRASRRARGVQ